jgi:hypothetical protein
MWVLNNEGETMIYWRDQEKAIKPYLQQYKSFYIDKLIPIFRESEVDISQNFADTSPSAGQVSFNPYIKRYLIPGDLSYGDAHWYYT